MTEPSHEHRFSGRRFWGSLGTVDFVATKCGICGSLVRNARFELPACLVLVLVRGVPVGVSKGVMVFCVAGVALRDIPTCLKVSRVVLCDRCNTLARFSEGDLHFRGRLSTLDAIFIFCVACAARSTCRAACFIDIVRPRGVVTT